MMLATPSTASSGRAALDITTLEGTHIFDLKLDGVRAWVVMVDGFVTLRNRNNVTITNRYPDVVLALEDAFEGTGATFTLDGEIVSVDGSFNTLSHRDRTNNPTPAAVAARPVRFVAFDLLDYAGIDLRGKPWTSRREALDTLEPVLTPANVILSPWSDDPAYLLDVRSHGGEGVIAKRKTSTYTFGRSREWVKFKNLHSISCIAFGYEPGNGSRSAFGAMLLAMIGPDGSVAPWRGRVGSGFTDQDCVTLKQALDAGSTPVVEIECLNKGADGALRFPVYKGIRSDRSPRDCTLDQLDTIPTY